MRLLSQRRCLESRARRWSAPAGGKCVRLHCALNINSKCVPWRDTTHMIDVAVCEAAWDQVSIEAYWRCWGRGQCVEKRMDVRRSHVVGAVLASLWAHQNVSSSRQGSPWHSQYDVVMFWVGHIVQALSSDIRTRGRGARGGYSCSVSSMRVAQVNDIQQYIGASNNNQVQKRDHVGGALHLQFGKLVWAVDKPCEVARASCHMTLTTYGRPPIASSSKQG